ncbi:hypothetical protein ACQCN2_11005 [Brevibacillus ginsengisoli]|uniref:hypothetical protein n=1 Tax=Brevibacillus ginsengisoli TaxID=363854 RepID=UPI003CF855A5
MRKMIVRLAVVSLVGLSLLTGCTPLQGNQNSTSQSAASQQVKSDVIATVNNEQITAKDLEFFKQTNLIQLEIKKEELKKKYHGDELKRELEYLDTNIKGATDNNTVLTQSIRLIGISLLAKEKGYSVSEKDVQQEMTKQKNLYQSQPNVAKIMEDFGEADFWKHEEKRQEQLYLAAKVQKDMIEQTKKENPKASEKQIAYDAEKKYEDLLVSQMGTLKITFSHKN